MKNILFYGDSNTWGFDPSTHERYPFEKRWTSICAGILGEGYNCIPAGMNGRTTVFDDPVKGCRNGLTALDYELQTHKPLDLAVVMLGTNDLKHTDVEGSAAGIRQVLEALFTANERFCLSYPVFPYGAKVLLVSPVLVKGKDWFGQGVDAAGESEKYSALYKKAGEEALKNCKEKRIKLSNAPEFEKTYKDCLIDITKLPVDLYFMDAAEYADPSDEDGVHLDAKGHEAIGKAVAEKIREVCRL